MLIEVSIGEIVDKYTILKIKSNKITNQNKLININKELSILQPIIDSIYDDISDELDSLFHINNLLWDIEDNIREKELINEFDNSFIELARSVYKTNDKRFEIKNKINNKLNSSIVEEKSYKKYE